jgi:polynucleotide 5'-hydroxyl-kinase GRC3/NOL9
MSEGRSAPDIPASWQPALAAARTGGTFFILGATDSGKTTLAAVLAGEASAAGRSVAVVDADVGQSSIGPPTCVGMAGVTHPIGSLEDLDVEAIDFVGTASPRGHLLQSAASAGAMAAAARSQGCDTLFVDTTGMVSGPSARALKAAKIRLLEPDFVVALQADDEVEPLLSPYRSRTRPRVLRLAVSRSVRGRSREERVARRRKKLGTYLAEGEAIELDWDRVPIDNSAWTTGEPAPGHVRAHAEECLRCEVLHAERGADGLLVITAGRGDSWGLRRLGDGFEGGARAIDVGALRGLLVGLLGERGETLGLGILEDADFRERRLRIYTPIGETGQIHGMRLGAMQIARDGSELAQHEPGALG